MALCWPAWPADEKPILLADGGGTDGVFDPVVVDLDAPVFEIGHWPSV